MNLCIIQARMSSQRLPGKVLMPVCGKPLLQFMMQRLAPSHTVQKFVVAATTLEGDDALVSLCSEMGIACFRGSEQDVLDRFYQTALTCGAGSGDHIIRICSDNALHSYHVLDFVVNEYHRYGLDYFSNSNYEPCYLEDGFDVEVCSFEALAAAWRDARLRSEREHVMPYIKHSGRFACGWRKAHPAYRYKLSVDTEEDLQAVNAITAALQHLPHFTIEDVVNLLTQRPDILQLNATSEINSGYKKSLREDGRA